MYRTMVGESAFVAESKAESAARDQVSALKDTGIGSYGMNRGIFILPGYRSSCRDGNAGWIK